MKRYRYYSSITLVLLFTGCSNIGNNKKQQSDTLFYHNGDIEQISRTVDGKLNGYSETYYESGGMKLKKYFVNDTAFGPMIEYFPNTRIKKFSYLVKDNVYTYAKEYNKAGTLIKEEGNPLVWYKFSKSLNNDTLLFKFLFCEFQLDSFQVEISSDAAHYKNFPLSNYKIDQTKQLNGWKLIRDLDKTSYYLKIKGNENGTSRTYNDTLTFEK